MLLLTVIHFTTAIIDLLSSYYDGKTKFEHDEKSVMRDANNIVLSDRCLNKWADRVLKQFKKRYIKRSYNLTLAL